MIAFRVKIATLRRMTTTLTLPRWYDLHAHFRQETLLAPMLAAHHAMGCAGILAMPNTKPPVGKVHEADDLPYWSIEGYQKMINEAGGDAFDTVITPLYLTPQTTPQMIEDGAASGLLQAVKYYPPHGTTGAEHAAGFEHFERNGVFAAMESHGVVLCVHGEEHGLNPEQYFARDGNAEDLFYRERLPRVIDAHPTLRIVAEHLTTKVGAELVKQAGEQLAATVTPQHLLYTVGHLLQGLKYHLYCLPVVKFEEDRTALRNAVTDPENTQFFAGTDSAPHTKKATACGCAAGCFTGGIAPQLYAKAFEQAGVDLGSENGQTIFTRFLCLNGAAYYKLPIPDATFSLTKKPQKVMPCPTPEGDILPLPLGLEGDGATLNWRIA